MGSHHVLEGTNIKRENAFLQKLGRGQGPRDSPVPTSSLAAVGLPTGKRSGHWNRDRESTGPHWLQSLTEAHPIRQAVVFLE
ncbi:hypothetical protein GGR40_003991 [Novosphingobium gossypii]